MNRVCLKNLLRPLAFLVLILPLFSELSASPYSQGRLAFARGDFDSAMRLLEESTRSDPSNGNAHFYIGLIHERKGRKPQSIQAYKQAVARRMDPDLREKALWKIVLYSRYVGDWGSVSIYSSQFLKYKHHPEMARLQSLAANQGGSSSAELVKLVQRAQSAEKEGDLTRAMGYYEEALEIDPERHGVRWALASVAMKANQYSRAIRHLQYLDRRDPEWKYTYKLGVCYYQMGRYRDALSSFDRATEQNKRPSSSFRYFMNLGRGLTYLELEDINRAEENLKAAARIKGSALLEGAFARIALMKGNRGEADRRVAAALKSEPDQLDALSVRALLSSEPSHYETYQDVLYRKTVYQPEYYNAVTLQYVHVLVARSKFDRARTVLESLEPDERKAIHKMKYDTASLSNRALILPGSRTESSRPAFSVSRTRILEEEIQLFQLFENSDRAATAIQSLREELAASRNANRATDSAGPNPADPTMENGGNPEERENTGNVPSGKESTSKETAEPDSRAGWLRQYPERLEYVARLELLDLQIKDGHTGRALQMAKFWNSRSDRFKQQAAELESVRSLINRDPAWAAVYAPEEVQPEDAGEKEQPSPAGKDPQPGPGGDDNPATGTEKGPGNHDRPAKEGSESGEAGESNESREPGPTNESSHSANPSATRGQPGGRKPGGDAEPGSGAASQDTPEKEQREGIEETED